MTAPSLLSPSAHKPCPAIPGFRHHPTFKPTNGLGPEPGAVLSLTAPAFARTSPQPLLCLPSSTPRCFCWVPSRAVSPCLQQQRDQKARAEDTAGALVPPCPGQRLAIPCELPVVSSTPITAPIPSPVPSSHQHQGTLLALNIQFPSPSPPCKGVQHRNEPAGLLMPWRDVSVRVLCASLLQKRLGAEESHIPQHTAEQWPWGPGSPSPPPPPDCSPVHLLL